MPITKSATECLVHRGIANFLDIPQQAPTVIFSDSSAAVAIADSDTSSKRMKHIATRLAFLRECIANKEIMMYHIRNTGQVADIFTKPLSAASFHVLRELLLGGN